MLAFVNRARTKRADGEDGFTLIELLVVVVILGILIAIAIPVYLNYKKSANDKAAQSDLRNAISVLEVCNSDGAYPSAIQGDPGTVATYGNLTACATAGVTKLSLSSGTGLKYTLASGSYILVGNNSGGSGKIYCYNSSAAGGVQQLSSTGTTYASLSATGVTC